MNIDYQPLQGRVALENGYQTYLPSPPLNQWIQSFWQLNIPCGKFCYRSIPDNSVDLIVNLNRPEDIIIVPPFISSIVFELSGPVSYFGIRFRILGHQSLIPAPLGEWKDAGETTNPAEMLPNNTLDALYECIGKPLLFHARCEHVTTILLNAMSYPDIEPRLARYIRYCHNNIGSNISLSDKQCSEFGISSRQLRRLTQLHLGLSPREFSRVLRFQLTLRAMNTASYQATWAPHYYDQSHFIHEFKNLSGLTPTEFQNMSVLYNNDPGK